MPEFIPRNDRELREGVRTFYHDIVTKGEIAESILIKLPVGAWLSASALNMLLTFIEAIRLYGTEPRVFVDVLDSSVIRAIMHAEEPSDANVTLLKRVVEKLRFYEAMDFIEHLRKRRVVVQPSSEVLKMLQDKLNAYKAERKHLYSRRMLSLSPLVESDEEQFALTVRIGTLASILSTNLWGRLVLQRHIVHKSGGVHVSNCLIFIPLPCNRFKVVRVWYLRASRLCFW